jgi:hypothetical protein
MQFPSAPYATIEAETMNDECGMMHEGQSLLIHHSALCIHHLALCFE